MAVFGAGAMTSGRAGAALLGSFGVSPASGPPGTVVTVSGTDCSPGLVVDQHDYVLIAAVHLLPDARRVRVDASGNWHDSFTVQAGALLGTVAIVATCFTDGLPSLLTTYAPQSFVVTAPSPPATSPPTTVAGSAGGTAPPSSSPSGGGGGSGGSSGSPSAAGSGTPSVGSSSPGSGASSAAPGGSVAPAVAAGSEPLLEHQLTHEALRAGLHDPSLAAASPPHGTELGWLSWALLTTLIVSIAALAAWLRWTRVQWSGPGAEETGP
jgi:hypothetical protein